MLCHVFWSQVEYKIVLFYSICICIIVGKSHSVGHQLQTRQFRHTDLQPVEEDVIVNQERET